MKVLITGGKGFIGSNFNFGVKLSRADCDLMNFEDTCYTFKRIKPDTIIHTAGRIGGVLGNMEAKGQYCYENVVINTNVLEAARRAGVRRVLSFSSTCAYPENAPLPYKEQNFHDGMPHHAHYGYAYAKRMLDIMSRTYCEQYGVSYNCIVLGNVYGPGDHFNNIHGHVVPSLIGKCYYAWKNNIPFRVWGTGRPLRQFIYVKDVVNICYFLLDKYVEPGIINVCNPEEHSILELSEVIRLKFDDNIQREFDYNRPDGQYRKPANIDKFRQLYKEFNFTSLEKGIEETVKYYKQLKDIENE